VRGVVQSMVGALEGGATHMGVATDHVIESWRNARWPGYKTGDGIDPLLLAQFQPLEDALGALDLVVWPMVEFEADDALAAAALMAAADTRVEQVIICSPDKDLAQCVRGDRIVQLDRRTRTLRNESGVREKFGVPPASIPDWLALVGDSADGYPGLPGWGPSSPASASRPCCSGSSPPCVRMHRSEATWTPCDGKGHAPISRRGPSGSGLSTFTTVRAG
jgi:5'-3' exonuclease, N-terminal resolvase-like domain